MFIYICLYVPVTHPLPLPRSPEGGCDKDPSTPEPHGADVPRTPHTETPRGDVPMPPQSIVPPDTPPITPSALYPHATPSQITIPPTTVPQKDSSRVQASLCGESSATPYLLRSLCATPQNNVPKIPPFPLSISVPAMSWDQHNHSHRHLLFPLHQKLGVRGEQSLRSPLQTVLPSLPQALHFDPPSPVFPILLLLRLSTIPLGQRVASSQTN